MAKEIESLTPEQEARMPEYVKKWIEIGTCLKPMKRKKVRDDIRKVYEAGGLEPPECIIFFDSPKAATLFLNILHDNDEYNWEERIGKKTEKEEIDGKEHWTVNAKGISVLNRLKKDSAHLSIDSYNHIACYGSFDASWLSFYDFFLQEFDLECCKKLEGLMNMAQNTGWFFPFENFVIVTDRPTQINLDDDGRLHNEDGFAIQYRDKWGFCCWHGVRVDNYVIFEPEKITIEDIEGEENVEVRRVKIEKYGEQRYLEDSGSEVLMEDEYGVLLHKEIPDDEDIRMVKVLNSTPEPDGTIKTYFLRVPPETRTARAGIAWTFGMEEHEYAPLAQT
jgi:hypothetical protein